MSKIQTIDITDTLIEYGPSTIDLNSQSVVYTFVKFKNKGRILELGILRSGQSEFESMLGIENVRFVWIDGKNISSKKKERLLTAFGTKDKSYITDILDEETHGDKANAIKWMKRILVITRTASAIAILPSLFFIPFTIPLVFTLWFSQKALNQLNSFIDNHKSIKNQFINAEKI